MSTSCMSVTCWEALLCYSACWLQATMTGTGVKSTTAGRLSVPSHGRHLSKSCAQVGLIGYFDFGNGDSLMPIPIDVCSSDAWPCSPLWLLQPVNPLQMNAHPTPGATCHERRAPLFEHRDPLFTARLSI